MRLRGFCFLSSCVLDVLTFFVYHLAQARCICSSAAMTIHTLNLSSLSSYQTTICDRETDRRLTRHCVFYLSTPVTDSFPPRRPSRGHPMQSDIRLPYPNMHPLHPHSNTKVDTKAPLNISALQTLDLSTDDQDRLVVLIWMYGTVKSTAQNNLAAGLISQCP